jgi:hypothetical protein
MARNQRDFTYDDALEVSDGGAIVADGYAEVAGVATTLDLGAGRVDARVVLDLDTIVTNGAAPESYGVRVRLSNSATFASGVVLGTGLLLGAAAATGASASNAAGERHEIPFTNEVNGTVYRYARLHVDVGGTAPSIDFASFVVLA